MMKAPKLNHMKDLVAVKGLQIPPVKFINKGGAITEASVTPELPTGLHLSIHDKTAWIEGRPQKVSANTLYKITGVNKTGSAEASIMIAVIEAPIKDQRGEVIRVHNQRQQKR